MMANKPLQSIKFPGLSDTYTTPQVDATLTTTGAAADAKKVGDEITSVKQDLSNTIQSGTTVYKVKYSGKRSFATIDTITADTTRCTTDVFSLLKGYTLTITGNTSGYKYAICGVYDDNTTYDSGWFTGNMCFSPVKSGRFYLNCATSSGSGTVSPSDFSAMTISISNIPYFFAERSEFVSVDKSISIPLSPTWEKGVISASNSISASSNGVVSPVMKDVSAIELSDTCSAYILLFKKGLYLGKLNDYGAIDKNSGHWRSFTGRIETSNIFKAFDADEIRISVVPLDSTTITTETVQTYGDTHCTFYKRFVSDLHDTHDVLNEHDAEIDKLISKVPKTTVQVVDLKDAVHSGTSTYKWTMFILPIKYIGNYYINPTGEGIQLLYAKPYNYRDEPIQLYRNGFSFSTLSIPQNGYLKVIDKRTFQTYNGSGNLSWNWSTDEDVAYFANNDASYPIQLGTVSDSEMLMGFTFGASSESYVPFAGEHPDVSFAFSDQLDNHVYNHLATERTDSEPTDFSDNFVLSKNIFANLLKDSYNLVDPTWFNWNGSGAYIYLMSDIYVPVQAGKYLLTNAGKVQYIFYDSEKTQISQIGTSNKFDAILVPEGAVYFRCNINSSYLPLNNEIVIYYSENETSQKDDRKPYVPHRNLIGLRGSNEIFDHYFPNSLNAEILQMAKYSAIRNMNLCNNVIRIGSFNMYISRTTSGWGTSKKMLKDYAVDIMGFQEVSNSESRIWTEFLKSWQFPYGENDAPVAVASQFEILSHSTYITSVTERKFMKAVIQLPKYLGRIDPTLSIYNYHGIWDGGTYEKRAQEIQDVLAVIANDTSDFIVIVGDTNAPAPHSEWNIWEQAGFTPVQTGAAVTTIGGGSLDNIFISQGIACKNFNVIPSYDYLVNVGGTDVPLSDHNCIFADLQFDFDMLLENANNSNE